MENEKIYCERCNERLDPKTAVWLELSNTDGKYYTEIPKGHISQGGFSFGKACAKIELKSTSMNKAILFFALQNKVNFEIDTYGIATNKSVAELEKLGDALTSAEIDDVCELYRKLGEFYVHDLPNYKR